MVIAITSGQGQVGGVREDYRSLTSREREILEMLLSIDAPASTSFGRRCRSQSGTVGLRVRFFLSQR